MTREGVQLLFRGFIPNAAQAAWESPSYGSHQASRGDLLRGMVLKVRARYFTTLRELAGTSEEAIEMKDGSTVTDLIRRITEKYGEEASRYLYVDETGEIDPTMQFLVNGASIRRLQGLRTRLTDGDIVAVIPPIGGGRLG